MRPRPDAETLGHLCPASRNVLKGGGSVAPAGASGLPPEKGSLRQHPYTPKIRLSHIWRKIPGVTPSHISADIPAIPSLQAASRQSIAPKSLTASNRHRDSVN